MTVTLATPILFVPPPPLPLVTACKLAKSPKATLYTRGFSSFVTSGIPSRCGPAPFTAHTTPSLSIRSDFPRTTVRARRKPLIVTL